MSRLDEPLVLMQRAVQSALADAGDPRLAERVGCIAVPHGRWQYRDPGGWIAAQLGSPARSVLAEVGVLQQTIISAACERVAGGESEVEIVVGGDAGHRIRVLARQGLEPVDTVVDREPDVLLRPQKPLRLPIEEELGLTRAVGYYAIIDSAFRHARGIDTDVWRRRIADRYQRFSEVAATNPDAWRREVVSSDTIREATPSNPFMAFPYTRRHATSWSVDQAAALVIASEAVADEFGVDVARRVYPVVSTENNWMTNVVERGQLGASPGAKHVAQQLLERIPEGSLTEPLVDLYSCFPIAVELLADAFGLSDQAVGTVTGGMNLAGGPYNNYVFQSTASLVDALRRSDKPSTGVATCVSGYMTKQAAAAWSNVEPSEPYANVDVSALVERDTDVLPTTTAHAGAATVAGYTVLHAPGNAPTAIVVLDLPDGGRTAARSTCDEIIARMQADESWIGRTVTVSDLEFTDG